MHCVLTSSLDKLAAIMTWRWRVEFRILRYLGASHLWPHVEKQSLSWVLAQCWLRPLHGAEVYILGNWVWAGK